MATVSNTLVPVLVATFSGQSVSTQREFVVRYFSNASGITRSELWTNTGNTGTNVIGTRIGDIETIPSGSNTLGPYVISALLNSATTTATVYVYKLSASIIDL